MATSRITVFGGTFDPIHAGHVTVVRFALENFGSCCIAPTERNPWKAQQPTPLALRCEMIALVLSAEGILRSEKPTDPGVYVEITPYQYSRDLVLSLRSRFPDSNIQWLVGSDSAEDVVNWKDWSSLGVSHVVAPVLMDMHSTAVRGGACPIHPALKCFIEKHHLYSEKSGR